MAASTGPDPGAPLPRRIRHHYFDAFREPWRERLFLSSIGFDTGAVAARAITHMIRHGIGPFRNLTAGGRHLHHLVFGIAGLLGTGYAWLLIADSAGEQRTVHRVTAFGYGLGAALTLDEFALWLDLQDVYWDRQGRVSVEAVMIFGGALGVGVLGGPFLARAAGELMRSGRR